jgi:hypothetical protein
MSWAIKLLWTGEVLKPAHPMREELKVGSVHRFVLDDERSIASHNHYFAALQIAYNNLPENTQARFQCFEHFRAWCLMKCGYAKQDLYPMDTEKDAKVLATAIGGRHPFAIITISGTTVQVLTPMSQSKSAMGHDLFQASKVAVLDLAASMIGISTDELKANAKRGDT